MFLYSLIRSGASLPEIIICVLSLALAGGLSIIVHEIAHGYVALLCGDPTAKINNRLTLNPVVHFDPIGLILILLVGFGWAKPVPIDPRNFRHRKRDMFFVSAAGVTANLIMGGIGLLLLHFLYPYFSVDAGNVIFVFQTLGLYFLLFFVQINFMQAFFNLLPIYPLDGFRLVNVFLKPGNSYARFMYRYGSYCLLGLVLLGNVLRAVNLEQFDVFYWVNYLIRSLIALVV
ncbi:MAG: site-2 protease family protein [Clostridia bacterium]|nr:site-2 protease family protein [Clostridia bacterium]